MTTLIDRKQYPELDLILWDNHNRYIEPGLAFQVYETRWPYIAHARMNNDEMALVQALAQQFGNGLILSA